MGGKIMDESSRGDSGSDLRQDAVSLFLAGVQAVKPDVAVARACRLEGNVLSIRERKFHLREYHNIYIVGAGKATAPMAAAIESLLGDRITDGVIVVKYGHTVPLGRIRTIEAAHPVPDEAGARGAREVLRMARVAQKDDLVICLISGGGSSLLPLPQDGLFLKDKQETTSALLACGASIHEINSVRKHLSAIKGGRLAKAVWPATLVSLLISDVIGDDLDTIASGPTVPDSSTFTDCADIIDKYKLAEKLPPRVVAVLEQGVRGTLAETAKPGESCFAKSCRFILAGNRDALSRVEQEARQKGYNTLILSSMVEGESREVARALVAIAKESALTGRPVAPPACILAGGETTVTLKGKGKGGRNQEMALSAAMAIGDLSITFLACGTDGNDGPTDAAGAVVDGSSLRRAKDLHLRPLSYLTENDSYHFFEKTGELVRTGPTNTNVMDLMIMLIPKGGL